MPSQYSLTPFSRASDVGYDLPIRETYRAVTHGLVGAGRTLLVEETNTATVYARGNIFATLRRAGTMSITVNAVVNLRLNAVNRETFAARLLHAAHVGKSVPLSETHGGTVQVKAVLSKVYVESEAYAAGVSSYADVGKNLVSSETYGGVVLGLSDLDRYGYVTCLYNGVLPAGSTLIIDSDRYTVTVDGVNAIADYSGDWLVLERGARLLAASAEVDGTITYTPRYL